MAAVKYWIWLAQLGCGPAWQVLDHFGSPEQAYFADPEEYELVPGIPGTVKEELKRRDLTEAEWILGECQRLGISVLTWQDAEYPERLKNIDLPPLVLYWKGRWFRFDEEPVLAVAGTRDCSVYGREMAGRMAFELTRLGGLVVTGVVSGCDYAAATGALKAGGPVVCVLAGGLDVPYNTRSPRLYADVAANGALISEYPPGTAHAGPHFLARNRILTGLSLGVVCIEASLGSGTLKVAALAIDQNRDVYAVPANVGAPSSAGTNGLLKKGLAIAVETGGDVLEHYRFRFPELVRRDTLTPAEETARLEAGQGEEAAPAGARTSPAREKGRRKEPAPAENPVDKQDSKVYIDLSDHLAEFTDDERAVLLALAERQMQADELIDRTQIPAGRVLSTLTLLTIRGMVRENPGKRYEALTILR